MSIKLIVTDQGDPSVGIFPESWLVESPIIDKNEKENLEFFKAEIIKLYDSFCDGKCVAGYDFEWKQDLSDEF